MVSLRTKSYVLIILICFCLFFSFLLQCLQNELKKHLPTFLIDPEQHGPLPAGIGKHELLKMQLTNFFIELIVLFVHTILHVEY